MFCAWLLLFLARSCDRLVLSFCHEAFVELLLASVRTEPFQNRAHDFWLLSVCSWLRLSTDPVSRGGVVRAMSGRDDRAGTLISGVVGLRPLVFLVGTF